LIAINSGVKDIREVIDKAKQQSGSFIYHQNLFYLLMRFIVLVNRNKIRFLPPLKRMDYANGRNNNQFEVIPTAIALPRSIY
jgi:hypothetical protein